MQGDAAAAYDALAAKLPVEVEFPRGDGTTVKRQLTSAMLEANAFYALYGPDDRATFLRALAAAARGELLPMLHLGYSNLAVDPETEEGVADPAWFGAAYYAITCTDYGEGTADSEATARAIIERAKAFAPRAPRLLRSYFAERLACAFWPKRGSNERPKPYAGGEFPTLILNADADPITPITMSYTILDNAKDSYMVAMKNGPHVIWGRGLSCPDEIVFALMFDGTPPEDKEQVCTQELIGTLYAADADRCGGGRRCVPGGAVGGDRDRAIAGARQLGRRRPACGRLRLRRRGGGERRGGGHRLHLQQVRVVAGPGAGRQRHADRRGRADPGPRRQRRASGADHATATTRRRTR